MRATTSERARKGAIPQQVSTARKGGSAAKAHNGPGLSDVSPACGEPEDFKEGPASPKPKEAATSASLPDPRARRLTKLELLAERLSAAQGATLTDLCEATGWQVHSVRGAIAGALKRKGLIVASDKADAGPRRYRIVAQP